MAVLQGIRYDLTGPDGTIAVINDSADPNFVGYLTQPPSGLDGAPIRETADDRVDDHGGTHGPFVLSRRPVVLQGIILPSGVQATDEARQNRLLTASLALDTDMTLAWTESVRGALRLLLRTQQPTRITDRRPKAFMVAGVSADHRMESAVEQQQAIALAAGSNLTPQFNHAGNIGGAWRVRFGPPAATTWAAGTVITMSIETAAGVLYSTHAITLPAGVTINGTNGELIEIDQRSRAARKINAAGVQITDLRGSVTFDPKNWVPLRPGGGKVRLAGVPANGANGIFYWRTAYAQ